MNTHCIADGTLRRQGGVVLSCVVVWRGDGCGEMVAWRWLWGRVYNKKTEDHSSVVSVPRTRLELARANAHYPLKVACLPISPPGL